MIIYKTTNLINGKIYVGKDKYNNPTYLGSGVLIKKAFKKYGKRNFQKRVLEYCKNLKELAVRERYWITLLNSNDKNVGYNICEGGDGGDTFTHQLPEKQQEIKRLKKATAWKTRTELHKKLIKDGQARARARGTLIGRPSTLWENCDNVMALQEKGVGIRAISRQLALPVSSVHKIIHVTSKQVCH